jgi:membrane-associated protease RseP (regulator of RpoE activity)
VEFAALDLFADWWLPVPVSLDVGALLAGLPFGLTLVGILALHEAGHYVAARRYRITVTPPYFIPFPPYVSVIGTLGAFIRLRSPVLSRKHLLDVGVAGPLLSFFASVPVLWWGLLHSRVLSVPFEAPSLYLVRFASERFWLGGSPIVLAITRALVGATPAGQTIELHPVAFAGWLGLFVTALNLLPISQLDGGHILYAVLGPRQKALAWAFFLALIPLGFLWAGWWVWAALVLLVGRGRIQHPPLFDAGEPLNRERVYVSLAAAAIFLLCFVPMPFRI